MKALKYSLAAAGLMFAAQAATAAPLGMVEFERWTNNQSPMEVDLGGVNALADAVATTNDYTGTPTLPGGLPANYSIHIDRTYIGDGNDTTADVVHDKYWFKLDPASTGGASAMADATLTIATGYHTGMTGVRFWMYEADAAGNSTGGPLGMIDGAGNIVLNGVDPGDRFILKVTGHLRTDNPNTAKNESWDTARYDLVLGLEALSAVPVPPALLLLITGLGALFGFGRIRKGATATA